MMVKRAAWIPAFAGMTGWDGNDVMRRLGKVAEAQPETLGGLAWAGESRCPMVSRLIRI